MMSVEEYALDVNKSVEEILKKCKLLNIKVSDGTKAKVPVPYLIGKDIDTAKQELLDADLPCRGYHQGKR